MISSGEINVFLAPRYITDNLENFLAEAELGLAYIKQPDGKFIQGDKLKNYLPLLLRRSVTCSALLTPLFSILAHVNEMQNPQNRTFLHTTELMTKYFSDTFNQLSMADQTRLVAHQERLANLIKHGAKKSEIDYVQSMIDQFVIFDSKHFKYARFQSIAALNYIPEAQLSAEQLQYLKEPEVHQQLDEEQSLVSSTLEYYREHRN